MRHRTVIAAALGAIAAGVTAVGASTLLRHHSGRLTVTTDCTLDDLLSFPDGMLRLCDVAGDHTGPATAILAEQYAEAIGQRPERVDRALHAIAVAEGFDHLGASTPASSVVETFGYQETIRSFVEAIVVTVRDLSLVELSAQHIGHDPESCDGIDPEDVIVAVARHLLEAAIAYETDHDDHLPQCRTCQAAGPLAPALLRARLCRDLADDALTNAHSDDILVRALPVQAAFDVTLVFFQALHQVTGNSPAEQIEQMKTGLADVISLRDRREAA